MECQNDSDCNKEADFKVGIGGDYSYLCEGHTDHLDLDSPLVDFERLNQPEGSGDDGD